MRSFRLLGGYLRRYFLQWFAWRSFAFTLVSNQAVTPLIGLAVWSVALPGYEVTTYYAALLVVRMLTVSYESHTFSERIYQGELADCLIRPHPVILEPLGENLALRIWHLLIALPVIIGIALFVPTQTSLSAVALALPALLLAAALRFLYTYTLALSAFWTERAHATVGLGSTLIFLLGGEAAPVHLLPAAIQPWAAAMPFRAMSGFPAEIAAGVLRPEQIWIGYCWQLIWLAALGALSVVTWRAGVRRYTAVGG